MQKLGSHLIVEYYGCNPKILNDLHSIKNHLLIAADKIGATVIDEKFHQFSPQGVSGAVILAESHISIHTWPEYGYAAMDFFTCGVKCDPYQGFTYLKQVFESKLEEVKDLVRGLPDDHSYH